uniref:Bulb-type lectin domain-containing protein n=1 Tax=Amphora coffeiformis TaxID=265554 RepID=A0A7S3L6H6_9STRA
MMKLLSISGLWWFLLAVGFVHGEGLVGSNNARGLKMMMRKWNKGQMRKHYWNRDRPSYSSSSSSSKSSSKKVNAPKSLQKKSKRKRMSAKGKRIRMRPTKRTPHPTPMPSTGSAATPTRTPTTDTPTTLPSTQPTEFPPSEPLGVWVQSGSDIILDLSDGASIPPPGNVAIATSTNGDMVLAGLSGQVVAFQYDNDMEDWVQMGQTLSFAVEYLAMASSGTRIALSSSSGITRVYEYNATSRSWIPLGADITDDSIQEPVALAMSGNGSILVTGGNYNNFGGLGIPTRAYEFNTANNEWVQMGQDITDGQASNAFVDVSSDGDIVAVGYPSEEPSFARVYRYDSGTDGWIQVGQDIEGQFQFSRAGSSVVLSAMGDRIVVGDPGGGNGGIVQVFEFNEGTASWEQIGSNMGQINEFTFDTGVNVAASADGNIVTYGPYGNGYDDEAHVAVFQFDDATNDWSQLGQSLLRGNSQTGQVSAYFVSVALSFDGRVLVTGSIESKQEGSDFLFDGRVRIFTFS